MPAGEPASGLVLRSTYDPWLLYVGTGCFSLLLAVATFMLAIQAADVVVPVCFAGLAVFLFWIARSKARQPGDDVASRCLLGPGGLQLVSFMLAAIIGFSVLTWRIDSLWQLFFGPPIAIAFIQAVFLLAIRADRKEQAAAALLVSLWGWVTGYVAFAVTLA